MGIYILLPILFLFSFLTARGQERVDVIRVKDITPKESFFKKFEGSVSVAPHYSNESGAGIMFAYATKENFNFVGNISSKESAFAGVSAAYAPGNGKWQLQYDIFYYVSSPYIWGTGYTNANVYDNKVELSRRNFIVRGKGLYGITRNFSAGPVCSYEFVKWEGLSTIKALSYGIESRYDTRDNLVSPTQGVFVLFRQNNSTCFENKPFYGTLLQADAYFQIWNGGIIATDILGEFTYGEVPVPMLPTIGGTDRMRGYYKGRYRDNNAVSAQIELRQHIWAIFGMAAWVGTANVWGKSESFKISHTLPNAGLGLRFQLNDNASLRLDFGVGKDGQNGFVFGLNEAF